MFVCTLKFDKKKAIFIVVMAALVLIGIILLAGALSKARGSERSTGDLTTEAGRAAYLSQYGWEVETPAVSEENVLIPKTFSDVFENYNELQLSQGFDLSKYGGMEVKLYTYKVTNYDSDETVLAQLYICKGQVIGGDVHSSALDGFMCGIKDT